MIFWRYKKLTALVIIFALIYLAQLILTEPDKAALAKYHISAGQSLVIGLTFAIPILAIWWVALLGYLRFRAYATSIEGGKDGEAFTRISAGILLFTLWLPVSSVLAGIIRHYYQLHPEATANMVRLDNYANLIILFPAFWFINKGAAKLLPIVKRPAYAMSQRSVMLFIIFSALYVFLTLHDPARQFSTELSSRAAYYLPDWLTVTTIIIPRLVMWFLGLQAIAYIYLYRQKVKGTIYRNALSELARGLTWVVITIIVLRCLQSFSNQLNQLSLGPLLIFIYLLVALISVGYILIARGAKNLQRIEEL